MTKTINQNQLFSTFDLGLASALISAGYQLQELDKSNPKKVQFCFQQGESLNQAVEDYFSGNFQVDAQTYWNSVKSIKNRLYSG